MYQTLAQFNTSGGVPIANAVARAPLTIEIQNPRLGGNGFSGDFEHEDDQHLFSFPFLYCFLGYTTCIDPPSKILSPSSFIEYTIQVHYSKKKMIHHVPDSVFLFSFLGWGGRYSHFFQPEKYDFNTD